MNKELFENNVPATNQLKDSGSVRFYYSEGAKINVLFIGNSITLHGDRPEIGWHGERGMASSKIENDYVHQTVYMLEQKLGKINYCIAQVAAWECEFWNYELLKEKYTAAQEFCADIVIVRAGENSASKKEELIRLGYETYFDSMVKFFVTDRAKLVVVSDLFWAWETIDDAIKNVVKKNGYKLVSINDLGADKTMKAVGLFENTSVAAHPGDLGMKKIAERLVSAIMD